MLCDSQSKAETLLQTREKGQTSVLKTIIIMDAFSPELVERGTKCGVDIVSMQDMEVLLPEDQKRCTELPILSAEMICLLLYL